MIPKLISLGIENTLKIICDKITIRNILIINKNNKFDGIIDELDIKAESITFNKININYVNLKVRDLALRLRFKNKKYFIENCHTLIKMRLTRDNINKTLFNNKWKSLRNLIESFISMSFQSVEIKNQSIYFVPLDGSLNKNITYTLQHDKHAISLVNNINQEELPILYDKNIKVNSLFFYEGYIEIELNTKIIFT